MKYLVLACRQIVGSLFFVSGLIKANDPMGFGFKLEEYFSVGVLNMPIFEPVAMELAVLICVAEIVLGVALVFGSKSKLVVSLLMALILFFTFLTFYSAYFNKVTDCGCFGDALKLTPWQSFGKDVFLLTLITILFFKQKLIEVVEIKNDIIQVLISWVLIALFSGVVIGWYFPLLFSLITYTAVLAVKFFLGREKADWLMAGAVSVICLAFSIYCIQHLPVKDFRPYKEGNHIGELSACPPDAPQDVYEDTWYYSVNGETQTYTTAEKPWDIDGAEFVDRKSELVSKGCTPPIHDFVLEDIDGNDMTESVLSEKNILLVIEYDIKSTDTEAQAKANELAQAMMSNGHYAVGLSGSVRDAIAQKRHEYQNAFDYYTCDATALKTVIRSNPGFLLLQEGTIVKKWHYNDAPNTEELLALTK